MYTPEFLDIETLWEKLMSFPGSGVYPADYLLLLGALDTGWRVVEPVKELISNRKGVSCVYLFNLHHPARRQRRYLKIQLHDAVDHLITDEKWEVVPGINEGQTKWPTEIF
jgi:hypothetical protein